MENVHMFVDSFRLITCFGPNGDDEMHQRSLIVDTDEKSDEQKDQRGNEEKLVPLQRRLVVVHSQRLAIAIVDREDDVGTHIRFISIIFHC